MKSDLFNNKNVYKVLNVLLKKVRIRIYLSLFELFNYLKLKKIPILPLYLNIEPTNRCNFRCPHCQITYWNKKNCDLDLNKFKVIVAQFPNLNFIKLQGIGEPLLCKEFCEMLEYAEKDYINVNFTTNGSIKSKKLLRLVKNLNRTHIIFSIDGTDENTYKKMRPNGNIKSIIEYSSQLLKERGNKRYPKIIFWMVITKYNINQIEELIKLAKDMNVDSVGIQTTLSDWSKDKVKEVTELININFKSELINNSINKAKALAKSLDIELLIENNLLTKKKKCRQPFTGAFIAANGDIVPCCWISDSSTVKMGNIFEDKFEVIWNSEAYQDLRRSIKNHDLKDYCKGCYNYI